MHRESNQSVRKQIANFLIVFSVHPLCLGVSVVIPGHRNSYDCSIFTPFRSPSMKRILTLAVLLLAALPTHADEPKKLINVPYGTHPRQVLDFYQAKSDMPSPVVLYIHGGGWQNGDKKTNPQPFLDKGISVVAINYRYVKNAVEEKIEPPVKAPLEDAARALQFVRSKAVEWNIDKKRIGATGGSAGGCSSAWLAFHTRTANPRGKES